MLNSHPMKCSTCKYYQSGICRLNPVSLTVEADHFCFQWRDAIASAVPSSLKVLDKDLFTQFCVLPEAGFCVALADAKEKLASQLNVCERTVETRIKRLIHRGFIEILAVDWTKRKQIRFCVDPESEKSGEIKPKAWVDDLPGATPSSPAPSRRKWSSAQVVSVMVEGETVKFTEIAKRLPEMSRYAFARVLSDAVAANQITKTSQGLYRLT
jgi:hypothetical protein